MRIIGLVAASVSMLLAACSNQVEVRIYPNLYVVGDVKSELATPVVDEVVRLNPKKVLILVCRNTSARKHLQFNVELQARSNATLGGNFLDEGCNE